MYLDTNKSNECYGCFACKNACPVQAITLQEKEDTFLYPVIDIEKCINCNICRKVCPHTDKERRFFNYPSNCFAAINKNKEDFEDQGRS